ncbi:MAG: Gldg family protein [bacterium]
MASIFVYALSTNGFVDVVGFEDVMRTRWQGVFGALWPILWLCGTVPFLTIDRAIETSPVMMPKRRVQQAVNQGLAAALGVCLIFPVNFISSRHNQMWDFSYFKTSAAGSTTVSIVKSLKKPVVVRIFQPTSSDVLPELQRYFEPLEGPTLSLEVIDQASEPKLAQDLKVRDNGFIAISETSADGKPVNTQVVNVGDTMKDARRNLRKLDELVGKALLAMARGEMTAYVTRGHGELTWDRGEPAQRALQGFKQVMEFFNIKLKTLGLAEGLGEEIPADADMLIVLGPDRAFLPSEVAAIKRYLERGGSLLLALEPPTGAEPVGDDALPDLLKFLGVKTEDGILASEQQIVALTGGKYDRVNVTTGSFSTHPSTLVLASEPSAVFLSLAQGIDTEPNTTSSPIVTVRSSAQTWADLNKNLEFDTSAQEIKKARPVVIASTGGGEKGWRAVVTGDATMFSDLAVVVRGNQQFMADTTNWLARTESYAGKTESEEDVRIQHTKEGQAGWFYATVIGFPAILLVFGFIRTRRRTGGTV